jgi:hypothetical protein
VLWRLDVEKLADLGEVSPHRVGVVVDGEHLGRRFRLFASDLCLAIRPLKSNSESNRQR